MLLKKKHQKKQGLKPNPNGDKKKPAFALWFFASSGVYLGGCTTTSTTATASSMSHSAAWDPTTSSLAGQGCLSSAWVHRVPENMPWALCSTPPQEQQVRHPYEVGCPTWFYPNALQFSATWL